MIVTYFEAWLMAFALTQLVETPLYMWLARVGVARAFSLSLVTHPLVWYVIPPLCYGAGLSYRQMIVLDELFAWLAEAALLRLYGCRWRRALVVALVVNAASVVVGLVARAWFGLP
ncbi:MAG: hypothetical protein R2939_10455 [Kofleriaceae bacterium]